MRITTIALAAFFALGSSLAMAQGTGGGGGAGGGAGGAGGGAAGPGPLPENSGGGGSPPAITQYQNGAAAGKATTGTTGMSRTTHRRHYAR